MVEVLWLPWLSEPQLPTPLKGLAFQKDGPHRGNLETNAHKHAKIENCNRKLASRQQNI